MDYCPFSLELIDLIINELNPDLPALRSCALVCKNWLPSSRAQLFRRLHLRRSSGCFSTESWLRFLSDTPHLAPYIRELSILCERSSWISWDTALPTLLRKLLKNNVEQLELLGCDIPWLPAQLAAPLYALLRAPTMRRVSFRLCALPASCAALFGPALESLELSDVSIDSDVLVPGKGSRVRPRHIVIDGRATTEVVEWLIPSQPGSANAESEGEEMRDLQTLCVRYPGDEPDAQQAIERLLQHASSLQTLEISLYPVRELTESNPTSLCNAPSICYNHSLRELCLSHFDLESSSPSYQLPWLRELLARLTVKHMVQKIAIDVAMLQTRRRSPPALDACEWGEIDALLVTCCAPQLKEVQIRIADEQPGLRARFVACMPKLHAKGILRVM